MPKKLAVVTVERDSNGRFLVEIDEGGATGRIVTYEVRHGTMIVPAKGTLQSNPRYAPLVAEVFNLYGEEDTGG